MREFFLSIGSDQFTKCQIMPPQPEDDQDYGYGPEHPRTIVRQIQMGMIGVVGCPCKLSESGGAILQMAP